MKVFLNSISGIDDAIVAMHISKRHMDRETELAIRELTRHRLNLDGTRKLPENGVENKEAEVFDAFMEKLCKWGKKHTTLLRFIDLSFMVYGLHRGGQDDWDSHACRFNNRIIRSSTRLAAFGDEMSDYYKDKIMTTDQGLAVLGIQTLDRIEKDGVAYVKATNGYIREDMANVQDAKRGLYMLSIPSDFIFRINLCEFAHVYKERGQFGGANPEVKECAEKCADLLNKAHAQFTRDLLLEIKN